MNPETGATHAVDPRPRALLERYATLINQQVFELDTSLVQLDVPTSERIWFKGRARIVIAFHPSALEDEPEAEMLAVGSPLFDQLVSAVRARGHRYSAGTISPTIDPSPERAALGISTAGASVGETDLTFSLIPVGRLLARVSIHAGPRLEELLVETSPVNLTDGSIMPEQEPPSEGGHGENTYSANGWALQPSKPVADLLPLLFSDLERRLEADLIRLGQEVGRECAAETARLDGYYDKLQTELDDDESELSAADRRRAIEADRARRKAEEESRSRVRVIVHPVQLVEWAIPAQQAKWVLTTATGRTGAISATRFLVGTGKWVITCPSCGGSPQSICVCREGHAACPGCSSTCGVCGEACCTAHGLATCSVEGHAVCAVDQSTCSSCGQVFCTSHGGECSMLAHTVCLNCRVSCGKCGALACKTHTVLTSPGAPRGLRRLCTSCVTYCEGGRNEPVGLDEVVRCRSCNRQVCTHHQAMCAVDGTVHCSRHLRRSDRTGRLVCEEHRASCQDEPDAMLPADEVSPCATCGRILCSEHSGVCFADAQRHCRTHLSPVRDLPGRHACEPHRTTCHIDQVAFSMAGTAPCSVCGRLTCSEHLGACSYCGREACSRDLTQGRCGTCGSLKEAGDPEDTLVTAAVAAFGSEPPHGRPWRTARDATGTVVEINLGWTRKMVFTVLHGEAAPKTVVRHSILGSSRRE